MSQCDVAAFNRKCKSRGYPGVCLGQYVLPIYQKALAVLLLLLPLLLLLLLPLLSSVTHHREYPVAS